MLMSDAMKKLQGRQSHTNLLKYVKNLPDELEHKTEQKIPTDVEPKLNPDEIRPGHSFENQNWNLDEDFL